MTDAEFSEAVTVRLTADLVEALDRFIAEQCPPGTPKAEALAISFRDWAIGLGYLELPPPREDAN